MATDPRIALLIAIADDEFVIGHRLSEWTGWVPYIEEDLALSSIAQDEIAHARTLYQIVSAMDGRDIDALALGRAPHEYRNAILLERPNRDFAFTLARHWLYDTADDVRLSSLEATTFKELRDAVAVLRLEERYHLEHAESWFRRLAHGPVDARHRFAGALASCMTEAVALFEPLADEDALLADGTLPDAHETMLSTWLEHIGRALEAASLEHVLGGVDESGSGEMIPTSTGAIEATSPAEPLRVPGVGRRDGRWVHEGAFEGAGGRRGVHSEDFEPMWAEMTGLYRAHPGARW